MKRKSNTTHWLSAHPSALRLRAIKDIEGDKNHRDTKPIRLALLAQGDTPRCEERHWFGKQQKTTALILCLLISNSVLLAEENPFLGVRERTQWAIEQVMGHKAPVDTTSYATDGNADRQAKGKQSKKRNATDEGEKPAVQVQILNFQAETDKAQVKVTVTDMGTHFILDVACDQVIQGWLLKRQSSREVFLKGSAASDNPYRCRIRADRPYVRDFGLTVYVTQESVPAFVQLF